MTDPAAPAKSREKRATLSRDLVDFLIEFSIALNKHAMYPGGHPSLAPAADGVAQRLRGLLESRGRLSLGVARRQLIIEGVATDPRNPVLTDLADRLHRHHLGAVTFATGVTAGELEESLKLVAMDADRGTDPIGLKPRAEIPRWPHVELFPLTFERLELVGGEAGEPEEGGAHVTGGRGALLWVGLARAALAADELHRPGAAARRPAAEAKPLEPFAFRPSPAQPPRVPLTDAEVDAALADAKAGAIERDAAEPTAVAHAIESHERGTAYDQVIVGYLLQIADELKSAGGAGAAALKKKMSRLITTLDQGTLSRLVEMGGDSHQRRQFVLDASQGMAVDAVVDLVQAASGAGAPISGAMIRMLRKLSRHAERGPAARRALADSGLREQVAELVKGWALADPNPGGYSAALQKMAAAEPVLVTAEEQAYAPEADRIVAMALETGGTGAGLDRAIARLVDDGKVPDLLRLLDRAPRDSGARAAVAERLRDPAMLRNALAAPLVDFTLVDVLTRAMGDAAAQPLLEALIESESRQGRRALIDRLLRFPEGLRPLLPVHVTDQRWYVQRNILYLAAELPGTPTLDATPCRHHEDVRVRREALRVLFRQPAERTRAICTALTDEDPRVKRQAINATLEGGCPDAAVPLVVNIISDDAQESELRVAAIRALGAKGGRVALALLLKLTEIRRRSIVDFVARSTVSPETLAAIAALGALRSEPRARERLTLLSGGRDPDAARAAVAALGAD